MNRHPDPTLPAALTQHLAHSPIVAVDVGARGGLIPAWIPLRDHLLWIAFEPDERSRVDLDVTSTPARRHVLGTALAERRRRVTLHKTRDEGDSSIFPPHREFLAHFSRPERFDVVETTDHEADTLDSQMETLQIRSADVIKVDTQGSELLVLRGAERTLDGGVIAVDVEVEFSEMYRAQPLFADVDAFLRRFDLQLFDLAPRRWPYAAGADLSLARGPIIWAEAIYFRTLDAIRRDMERIEATARVGLLSKIVALALVYGFVDFAAAVIRVCGNLTGGREPFDEAVREWDGSVESLKVPVTVDLTASQARALRGIQSVTGNKPTAQIRKAVAAWIASQPVVNGFAP